MTGIVQRAENALAGWPDTALTAGLFAMATLAIAVALMAPRTVKLGVLAWMVAP